MFCVCISVEVIYIYIMFNGLPCYIMLAMQALKVHRTSALQGSQQNFLSVSHIATWTLTVSEYKLL